MSAGLWAVITDDEHLCFGPYPSEESAARVAERVAAEHDLDARCVELGYLDEREEES